MIVNIHGTRAAFKDNILAMARNSNDSTFVIEGETYRVIKKYPSVFNKGIFNYLLEKELPND